MSDAIISTGILLQAGDGATPTENFVTVAEVVSLKAPQVSRNEVDVSPVSVDEDAKLLGILRRGQVTGTANWVPGDVSHEALLADILANTKRNWRIAFPPDGFPHWTMPARVQLFDPQEVSADSPLQFAFAMTIDGTIVIVNEET